jgi:hypothetical protein
VRFLGFRCVEESSSDQVTGTDEPYFVDGRCRGVLAGPIGALGAALIVQGLGLGDDHIGERAVVEFTRPEKIGTPPKQGDVQPGMEYNAKVDIDGGDEGVYEVFFDVVVLGLPTPTTLEAPGG